ncbi:MAG TPA: porin [Albitalea sp.]|nr:porin [Albitalea sp.]
MKKSLLALAVLGAFAGAASAQSSVTVYGKIDVGGVLDAGAPPPSGGAHSVRVSSGVTGGSRLGFRGTEDLGGGMKANFVAETGFCADSNAGAPNFCTGGNNFMGRQAWVGLSGGFGSTQLGRQYTPAFFVLNAVDPFGTGYAGQITNLFDAAGTSAANPRFNNAVVYSTPNMGGFTGTLAFGAGETTGNWKAGRGTGFSAVYKGGPLYVGLGYHNVNNAAGTSSARKNTNLGAVYDFGPATLNAAYQTTKNGAQPYLDVADFMIGTTVKLGGGSLMASYISHNDKSALNRDARQLGVGYNYPLSKRTSIYTAVAKISNKNGATFTVGNATEAGTGNRAVNLGVVHNF